MLRSKAELAMRTIDPPSPRLQVEQLAAKLTASEEAERVLTARQEVRTAEEADWHGKFREKEGELASLQEQARQRGEGKSMLRACTPPGSTPHFPSEC